MPVCKLRLPTLGTVEHRGEGGDEGEEVRKGMGAREGMRVRDVTGRG